MASVQACGSTEEISRKRTHFPDTSDEMVCRSNCANHIKFVLESESPLPTDEDSESVYSVQLAGTASAKDTSDTSWTSDSVTMDVEIEEYDVASAHSDEKFFTDCDSSGSDGMMLATAVAASLLAEQASSVAADSGACPPLDGDSSPWSPDLRPSSSSSEDYSDIPPYDDWECARCKRKCWPPFRFCIKCFQLRKGYFGERPKRRHPRRRRQHQRQRSPSPPFPSPSPSSSLPRVDSGISISSEDKDDDPPAPETASAERAAEMCFMCLERPRDGAFQHHGRVGHVLTCYQCALKTWKRTKRCPMCNEPPVNILRVVIREDLL